MAETVRRCSGCNGVLEDWQPGVCSYQCGLTATATSGPDDDYEDDRNVFDCGGVVDGFGQVHSDADPGL